MSKEPEKILQLRSQYRSVRCKIQLLFPYIQQYIYDDMYDSISTKALRGFKKQSRFISKYDFRFGLIDEYIIHWFSELVRYLQWSFEYNFFLGFGFFLW